MNPPNRGFFVFIIVFCPTLFFVRGLDGQSIGTWIQSSGETIIQNMTPEQAKNLVRQKARLDAVEKVCGVHIRSETMVKDFTLIGDFLRSVSYGHVVEEKDVQWSVETIPSARTDEPPQILLKVRLWANVVPETGAPDPYFKIDLKLNRTFFQPGDEILVQIMPTTDCYVTVFDLAGNDSVYFLFPNRFQKDFPLEEKVVLEIPEKKLREAGVRLLAENRNGILQENRMIYAVATKKKLIFLYDTDQPESSALTTINKMSVFNLARRLSEIPVNERTDALVFYTVQREMKGEWMK